MNQPAESLGPSYHKLTGDAPVSRCAEPEKIGVVVVGGEKNAY